MTFTTNSPLADLIELSSSSGSFTPEQNRCLAENIAKLKQSQCCDAEEALRAPVTPYQSLAAASAVPVTHKNMKQYAARVAETLCWQHCHEALAAMRDGYVASL
jgi:hypothetical protein